MYRVANEGASCFRERLEAHRFAQLFKIWLAGRDLLKIGFDLVRRDRPILERGRPLLQILADLRQCRPAVRPRKFETVVLRRMVTAGDIHTSIELSVKDGV